MAGAVVEQEAIAIGGKDKRNIEGCSVLQGLLNACTYGVVVIFRFDKGYGDVGLVIKNIIGALALTAGDELAAYNDAAFGERTFRGFGIGYPSQTALRQE